MAKKDDKGLTIGSQAEAEPKEDTTWKDKPNAKIRRVFRATNPLTKTELATLMRRKSIINGTEMEAKFLSISVNHAAQYILADTFEDDDYAEQLKAMRRYEKAGTVIEMPPHWEGTLYVEPAPLTPAELRAQELAIENEKLLARIKELEKEGKKDE